MNQTLRILMSILLLFLCIASTSNAVANEKVLEISLKQGMLVSLIDPKDNKSEQAKAKRQQYYENAIPLAKQYGYQNHGPLRVTQKLVGNRELKTLIVATWPNEAADLTFETLPQWQPYKTMRPQIWDELNFYKAVNQQDKTLRFSEKKFYTIAFAYFNDKHPNDYHQYMAGIKSAAEAVGGRFIHKMQNPRFVTHSESIEQPNEINIVEWDSYDGISQFQKSEGFLDHAHLLNSGTRKFELYRISPIFK